MIYYYSESFLTGQLFLLFSQIYPDINKARIIQNPLILQSIEEIYCLEHEYDYDEKIIDVLCELKTWAKSVVDIDEFENGAKEIITIENKSRIGENRKPRIKNKKVKYVNKVGDKYMVQVYVDKKIEYIGTYDTEKYAEEVSLAIQEHLKKKE